MTLALAWTHVSGNTQQLICVTDSRLRFGGYWDCGPKLFPTCRGDSALMFAGDTIYAYPIIHHILAATAQYPKAANRAMDLPILKGHLLRVLNAALAEVRDLPKAIATPGVEFIFAGYDWREEKFKAWRLWYDREIRRFTFQPMGGWSHSPTKRLMIIGDYKDEFKTKLARVLRERGRLTADKFDLEPFEVLRDMLRSGDFPHIGGPPQIIKIYRHLNTTPIAVYWPSRNEGQVAISGRTLLEYEKTGLPILDPDLLTINGAGGAE